jgi:hypothetical protein
MGLIENAYRERVQAQIKDLELTEGKRQGKSYKASVDDVRKIARRVALQMDDVKELSGGRYEINARNLRTLGIPLSVGDYKKQLREELKAQGVIRGINDKFLNSYFTYKIESSLYQ